MFLVRKNGLLFLSWCIQIPWCCDYWTKYRKKWDPWTSFLFPSQISVWSISVLSASEKCGFFHWFLAIIYVSETMKRSLLICFNTHLCIHLHDIWINPFQTGIWNQGNSWVGRSKIIVEKFYGLISLFCLEYFNENYYLKSNFQRIHLNAFPSKHAWCNINWFSRFASVIFLNNLFFYNLEKIILYMPLMWMSILITSLGTQGFDQKMWFKKK